METDRLNRTVRMTCTLFALISTLLFSAPAWSESKDPKALEKIHDGMNEHGTLGKYIGSLNPEQLKTMNASIDASMREFIENMVGIEKENEGKRAEYNRQMAAEYADVEDSNLREDEADALMLYKPLYFNTESFGWKGRSGLLGSEKNEQDYLDQSTPARFALLLAYSLKVNKPWLYKPRSTPYPNEYRHFVYNISSEVDPKQFEDFFTKDYDEFSKEMAEDWDKIYGEGQAIGFKWENTEIKSIFYEPKKYKGFSIATVAVTLTDREKTIQIQMNDCILINKSWYNNSGLSWLGEASNK